jgi:prepilin-type N-terminal cleavage/methylation domain-containing protein
MMKIKHSRTRQKDGFTIAEVLMVMAIVGLIMGMIFWAVPATQRNSRNAQYKADASNIVSLVSQYQANRSGALPKCLTTNGSGRVSAGSVNPPVNDDTCNTSTGAVTTTVSNQTTSVSMIDRTTLPAGCIASCDTTVGTVVVYTAAVCNNSSFPSIDPSGNGSRQFVAWFGIESGGNRPYNQCLSP